MRASRMTQEYMAGVLVRGGEWWERKKKEKVESWARRNPSATPASLSTFCGR